MIRDLAWLGRRFAIDGEFVSAVPYGNGHINDTFAATYGTAGGRRRFVHQRINKEVFKDPPALMCNIARVTRHIRARLERESAADIGRRVLTLVPTRDGADFLIDDRGEYWRTYEFIEGATTYDVVDTPARAAEAARAFGEFQRQLVDLEGPPLAETIPDFHTTPLRLEAFRRAVEADVAGRASGVADEIRRFERYAPLADSVLSLVRAGAVPVRVAHNDTKINNVMIDEDTGAAVCVIDLDVVMPGLSLDDFGDLVRTSVCYAKEDDRDLSKVEVELPLFEALVRGYVGAVGDLLTEGETASLVLAGKVMTLECGLRFLADHLAGDTYFRVHHEGHNLDRARVQLSLLDSIEANERAMEKIVADMVSAGARIG